MAACNGHCAVAYDGYDNQNGLHNYSGWNCADPQNPVWESFSYATLIVADFQGTCANCNACIRLVAAPAMRSHGHAALSTSDYLRRAVWRKDVGRPANSFGKPDELFFPGPQATVIAEYTLVYQRRGEEFWARLLTIANSTVPGRLRHLGWELDPRSPASHVYVPHLASDWVSNVDPEPGGHFVDVKGIGTFWISTTRA